MFDRSLLKYFEDKHVWQQYRRYLDPASLTPAGRTVLSVVDQLHGSGDFSWDTVEANLAVAGDQVAGALAKTARATSVPDGFAYSFVVRSQLSKLHDLMQEWGRKLPQDVPEKLAALVKAMSFAKDKLPERKRLTAKAFEQGGLRKLPQQWRLPCLNLAFGAPTAGDFFVIVGRPDSGKTTLAISEATHLAQSGDMYPVLVINNEEESSRVEARAAQAYAGVTIAQAQKKPPKLDIAFEVCDTQGWDVGKVEALIADRAPKIVIFNVLDKVRLAKTSDNSAQNYRDLGGWCRELAHKYQCVVFALAQADGTAEGVRWLNQSQILFSKTSLQGECDGMIMIGRDNDPNVPEERRFLRIAKNKLPGGQGASHAHRRGMFEVNIDIDTARFVQ